MLRLEQSIKVGRLGMLMYLSPAAPLGMTCLITSEDLTPETTRGILPILLAKHIRCRAYSVREI